MKACTKCGTIKPPEEFHRNFRSADGRLNQCRKCRKEMRKGHRKYSKPKKNEDAWPAALRAQLAAFVKHRSKI